MGVASSKNSSSLEVVSESLSEAISSSMTSIAQQSISTVTPTQTIKIAASAGRDMSVDGVSQKIVANIDVQKFLSNVSEVSLQSMMRNALETTAKDNQQVENGLVFGGSRTSNSSDASVRSSNINRVVHSYSYSQFVSDVQAIMPSQTIDIAGSAARDVNLKNINQFIKVDLVSRQIADNMAKEVVGLINEADTKTKKDTTQKAQAGISGGMIATIIIVIVIVVAGGAALFYFKGGGKEMVQARMGGGDSLFGDEL